jgi:hypothetical protein
MESGFIWLSLDTSDGFFFVVNKEITFWASKMQGIS